MKKSLLGAVTALLICGTTSVHAQLEPGSFSIQPKLGLASTSLTDMPALPVAEHIELDRTFFPGFLIGAECEYQLSDRFSLAAGLNYTAQGGKWKDYRRPEFEIKKTQIVLGYINVPVLANVYLFDGFALKAGVQVGFLTNANAQSTFVEKTGGLHEIEKNDESILSDCRRWDFSIPVGISYELSDELIIDARYHFGLSRVNKEKDEDGNTRNRSLFLTIGYRFQL